MKPTNTFGKSGIYSTAYKLMLVAMTACMIGFSALPIIAQLRGGTVKDYALWHQVGQWYSQGSDLYEKDGTPFKFMYPPSCALMLGIIHTPNRLAFIVILTLINSAAWFVSILLTVYLVTGNALRQHPLLYLVPTAITLLYVLDNYLLGQPMLLLLALMLGAFACLRQWRPVEAGFLLGLAAAIKAFPVMAAGYLVYRRMWKALIALVLTLLILLLALPAISRGPSRAWDDLSTWTKGMVLKYDANGIAQRGARSQSYKNQSIMAVANRMLRRIPAGTDRKAGEWYVNRVDLSFNTVNIIIVCFSLALCIFYLWAMPRRTGETYESDAIEHAMLLMLILMFSPLSFTYFYVWLLYPLAIVTDQALVAPKGSAERNTMAIWLSVIAIALGVTIQFRQNPQAYGNTLWVTLSLFVGLGWKLRQLKRIPLVASSMSLS